MSRDHESSNTQDDYYAVLSDPSIDYASFTDDFVPPDEEYDEKEQDLIDDAWDFLNQYKLRYFLDDLLDQREDYLNSLNECAKNIKSNDSLLSNISKILTIFSSALFVGSTVYGILYFCKVDSICSPILLDSSSECTLPTS